MLQRIHNQNDRLDTKKEEEEKKPSECVLIHMNKCAIKETSSPYENWICLPNNMWKAVHSYTVYCATQCDSE